MARRRKKTEEPEAPATPEPVEAEQPATETASEPKPAEQPRPTPQIDIKHPAFLVSLAKDARLGGGDRKAGQAMLYVVPAGGVNADEVRNLLLNPQLQKVTREDVK